MLQGALRGAAAGGVGTMTLNLVTYVDMFLRGRPASEAPAKLAGVLADKADINLEFAGASDEQAQHRQQASGALLGYATGLGIGIAYGMLREQLDHVSLAGATIVLGLGAMAASDIPLAVTKVSDPRSWSASSWAADLIPHLAYGLLTAVSYDALAPNH